MLSRRACDGCGAVLTSTITDTLVDFRDAATGLVLLGEGRWYDPALGRPLQPNAAGGPPTVPQALNRYAATPMGQPGVVQAEIGSRLTQSVVRAVGPCGQCGQRHGPLYVRK